ncbi:MAG: hypothetical protein QOJ30_6191 [Pseudonocardiales bacterium]|jgi:uncharacterized protein YhaN|nr:hypothetical protein [Pseudonocardiales bacterium]
MRIRRLVLERYGPHEGRELLLGPGLTLVTGPNEAGKSTLLDALSDLLWGFPKPIRHNYAFSSARLALAADTEVDGRELCVRRTTRGLATTETDEPVDAPWGPGGAEARRRWRQGFGLGHAELRAGGARLCEGGGDLAELVFTARSGRDVRALLDKLDAEADGLFKTNRNSKSVALRQAMTQYETVDGQVRERMSRAGEVADLATEITRLERRAAALTRDREVAARASAEAAQRVRAFEPACRLASLRDAVAELQESGVVLDAERLAEFDAAHAVRERADTELAALREQIEELRARRAEVQLDEALVADAALVRELDAARQARAADAERAVALRRDAEDHARRVAELLDTIAPVADGPVPAGRPAPGAGLAARLAAVVIAADRVADLDRLAARVREAGEESGRADAAQHEAQRAARDAADEDEGPDATAVARVAEARRAVLADGSPVARRRAALAETADAARRRHEAVAGTGLHPDDETPEPPPAGRMAELRAALRDATLAAERAEGERERTARRLDAAHRMLDELAADGPPADPDSLAAARAARDAAVDAFLAAREPRESAAAALAVERAVRAADTVADRMIAAADRVAEHTRRRADLVAADQENADAERVAHAAAEIQTAAEEEWRALWPGIPAPRPDDAETVHHALVAARRAEADRAHAGERAEMLADDALSQADTLSVALAAAGRPRDDADLDAMIVAAEDLEADADRARDRRVLLGRLRAEVHRAAAAADARRQDLDEAELRWRHALRAAGVPAVTAPDGWDVRRDALLAAARAHAEGRRAAEEAEVLAARVARHDAAVAELAARHPDEKDGSAAAHLVALTERVRAAETAAVSAGHLDTQLATAEREVRERSRAADSAASVLDRLAVELSLTAAPEEGGIEAAAERGRTAVRLAGEIDTVLALLRTAAPDLDADELVEMSRSTEATGLDEALSRARESETALAAENDALLEQLGGLRSRLRTLEGAEGVAVLHAEAQEHLSRAADAAERYLVVHLQREILRRELESYERRHASPLLVEAGGLLERLTGGRFTGLRPGEGGRTLVAVRADGEELTPDQLSEGTADQAFLALRLAGVVALQAEREADGLPPVPVVLDDVLMTFDDGRAAAALGLLADLGQRWQVVLLTHHDHLAPLAPAAGSVAVVALDAPAALPSAG